MKVVALENGGGGMAEVPSRKWHMALRAGSNGGSGARGAVAAGTRRVAMAALSSAVAPMVHVC